MVPRLTPRERRVLTAKANGLSDPDTGILLGLSRRTVITTLHSIRRKYGTRSTGQCIAVALAVGDIGVQDIEIPTNGGVAS